MKYIKTQKKKLPSIQMAHIDQIQVTISKKIGLPNYSSAFFTATLSATPAENEKEKDIFMILWTRCWQEVNEQIDKRFDKLQQRFTYSAKGEI